MTDTAIAAKTSVAANAARFFFSVSHTSNHRLRPRMLNVCAAAFIRSSVSHARIEPYVNKIDDQVKHDDQYTIENDDTHDQRVVAV